MGMAFTAVFEVFGEIGSFTIEVCPGPRVAPFLDARRAIFFTNGVNREKERC